MNSSSPSPFQPLTPQSQPTRRARVKFAVFSVIALNVAFCLTLLLTQGCKRESSQSEQPPVDPLLTDTNTFDSIMDTNVVMDPWSPPATNAGTGLPPAQPPVLDPLTTQPPVTTYAPPAASTYTIKSGDTFDAIAKANSTTAAAIIAANPGVDPRRLKIGSTINLPAPSAPGATAPTAVESSGEIIYVVKSGDTLSRIASQHGTTVTAIKRLNNLSTDRITVNQKLKIPLKAPAPVPPVTDPLAPTTVR
jgi:LysM repeat protein